MLTVLIYTMLPLTPLVYVIMDTSRRMLKIASVCIIEADTRARIKAKKKKTYNSRYSLVVTDPTTNQPLGSLTRGERTGSRVFYQVWSYVEDGAGKLVYIDKLSLEPLEDLEHHLKTFSFSACHFKQLGNEFAYPSLDRVITCLDRCEHAGSCS